MTSDMVKCYREAILFCNLKNYFELAYNFDCPMKHSFFLLILILIALMGSAQEAFKPNYDESKVLPYSLPEVLKTSNNVVVKTRRIWEDVRRPEIVKLFEDNVYGQMPQQFDSIGFNLVNQNDDALDGQARSKEVDVRIFRNSQSVVIHLLLFVPKKLSKPAPVFLLINNRGAENTDVTRKTKSEFWPVEMVIDSGYAMASFHVRDLAPDNKDSFMNAALSLYPEQLSANNGMRAIGAWAWGAGRVLDYLKTDRDIDGEKVIVVGHSRGGKAALWAAAQDKRFAMCISNCSGNTGMALSRRRFGETVAVINTAFPHWFTTNYKKYNDNENALPVDQHMLASLIAPRPLYATNASKDLWADPVGTYLSLKQTEKVYSLYGLTSALPAQPPPIDKPITAPPLGYHNHEGVHNMMIYDWTNFVVFARKCFGK